MALLEVNHLSVTFGTGEHEMQAVKNVAFSIDKGEILALVGESGSGKSTAALSILQLLPYPTAHHSAESSIRFDGLELINAQESILRQVRGNRVSMIFQEPMTALNPLHTIYRQISEILFLHQPALSRADANTQVKQLLSDVELPYLHDRLNAFPHELSGGERQRVMIAMAMANRPDLLVADEPTTALDVTVQTQILKLLKSLQTKTGMAILLITHDLTVVRKVADRVAVMQRGEIVETAKTAQLFSAPAHPYTQKLLAAVPKGAAKTPPGERSIAMECENLRVNYPVGKPLFPWNQEFNNVLKGLSVRIAEGTTLGVVGESGSGKSTLGFSLLRLIKSEGAITFQGERIDGKNNAAMRPLRRAMQPVFQDPFSSMNPRMTVGDIIGEGLRVHHPKLTATQRAERVSTILQEVGLDATAKDRYPHEFSGGQRQRISIARAIILQPEFVMLDEPTSALDLSVQAQMIDLLTDLQEKYRLTYVFISHDLRVIKAMAHTIIVMKQGVIVEQGSAAEIFANPQHPYTQALIQAAFGEELL